jgi:UDP-2,3-diacylglucosamine pyrophosphatase LpxH
MIILISDLHLSDGTTAANISPEAFTLLQNEINSSFEENKAKELHLVLLGDIFDLVRTDFWIKDVRPEDRPWNGTFNQQTFMFENANDEENYRSVLKRIFENKNKSSEAFINMINELRNKYQDKFRITYVTGNHDLAFNCYDALKDDLIEKIPFMTRDDFKHIVYEPGYALLARHGNEWDEDCFSFDFYNKVLRNGADELERFDERLYKITSIGEVITAEFMSGLLYYIRKELDENKPDDMNFYESIKDLNNIRPMTLSFHWLSWFLEGNPQFEKYNRLLEQALLLASKGVYDCKLGKLWDSIKLWDKTDLFWWIHSIVKFGHNGLLNYVTDHLKGLIKDDEDKYLHGAESEFEKYENINYVFYGHTHNALHRFVSGKAAGESKMYINTGTYLPFIEKGINDSFAGAYQMTIAAVFQRDEDKTHGKENSYPTLELWNGVKRKIYK